MIDTIKVRFAVADEVSTIYKFIYQKAEFDRSVGAYSSIAV